MTDTGSPHYWTRTQAFLDDIDRADSLDPIDLGEYAPGRVGGIDTATPPADLGDEHTEPDAPTGPQPPAGDGQPPHGHTDRLAGNHSRAVDLGPPGQAHDVDDAGDGDRSAAAPLDADDETGDPAPHDDNDPKTSPRYNKALARGFVAATAAAALVTSGGLLAMRTSPHTAQDDHTSGPTTRLSIVAAPPATTSVAGEHDSPLPYTATSVGCLPGSTAAQGAAGPDATRAWVCVTGGNAGQYVVLDLGRSMLITAVSLTPGWVGADTSGTDQWHQHRVAARVQWSFNDSPPTVLPQDTGNVHGDATKATPERGVLASRIILLVQETARAPADAAPATASGPGPGGILGDVLGPPAGTQPPTTTPALLPGLPGAPSDPADNSFAVSSIKIFGHPPQ